MRSHFTVNFIALKFLKVLYIVIPDDDLVYILIKKMTLFLFWSTVYVLFPYICVCVCVCGVKMGNMH